MQQDPKERHIFVNIAAYRDVECQHTVNDLFAKATHPERVFVGLCWQYDPEMDNDCFLHPPTRPTQVRAVRYHVRDVQGAGWAKNEAQKLWGGGGYTLVIHAHTRFEPGWDAVLIHELERLPHPQCVLTGRLPDYLPPQRVQVVDEAFPVSVIERLVAPDDPQMVYLGQRLIEPPRGNLLPTCAWVSSFLFAHSTLFSKVPFDPYMYCLGEEINYSARLFTHGYDLYQLGRVALYHCWNRLDARGAEQYRDPKHPFNQRALARNRHLFGLEKSKDKAVLAELKHYSLGSARPLEDYWQFCGIDLPTGLIKPEAQRGQFATGQQRQFQPRIFVAIASFRDPETQPTIDDLLGSATYPKRVRVGVCLQWDEKEDARCMLAPHPNVRVVAVHYKESKGANWARAEALKLMQGEDYVLIIDSHMRFVPGWDEKLIDMLRRCPSDKPVISTFLHNYNPPDDRQYGGLARIKAGDFAGEDHPQLVHLAGMLVAQDDPEFSRLYPTPFCIHNFVFARAGMLNDVSIDPHLQFYGDETSLATRLYTHGYDVFQPDQIIAFHYWIREREWKQHHYRHVQTLEGQQSRARIRHLLGIEKSVDAAATAEMETYGLGTARCLQDWFVFAGIDLKEKSLSADSLRGVFKHAAKRPRIFVQIASFRDPECQWTVKDLFEKAAHPERIFVGICWQYNKAEDAHCFAVPYPRPQQVRVIEVDAGESKGVCWARQITQTLWQGEEYTLQIDSHMRFQVGWDNLLIEELAACETQPAVLSCYPAPYTLPSRLAFRPSLNVCCVDRFYPNGNIRGKGDDISFVPERPLKGLFLAAGFIFARSEFIRQFPYDPHSYFDQEEILLALRLFTHGWDIYSPRRTMLYHLYVDPKKVRTRKTYWDDRSAKEKAYIEVSSQKGIARLNHITGHTPSQDTDVTADLDQYGLGNIRSLAEFEMISGIDFKVKTVAEKAQHALFIPAVAKQGFTYAPAGQKPPPRIFVAMASFRDRKCQWTVKNLFEKAAHPQRVFVGICWQFDAKEDADCFEVTTRPEQVRILPFDWRESQGEAWARMQAESLWEGEEYRLYLASDAEMEPGWDETLVKETLAKTA